MAESSLGVEGLAQVSEAMIGGGSLGHLQVHLTFERLE